MTVGELLDVTPCLVDLVVTIREDGDGKFIQQYQIAPYLVVNSGDRRQGARLKIKEIYDSSNYKDTPIRYICINPHQIDANIRNLKICQMDITKPYYQAYKKYEYKGYRMRGYESKVYCNCYPEGWVPIEKKKKSDNVQADLKDQMNIYDFLDK